MSSCSRAAVPFESSLCGSAATRSRNCRVSSVRLARAVREVLAPAGRFAIVNWQRRRREETTVLGEPRGPRTELRMAPQQTVDAVAPAGLQLVELAELPPYHYAAIFARSPFQDARFVARNTA